MFDEKHICATNQAYIHNQLDELFVPHSVSKSVMDLQLAILKTCIQYSIIQNRLCLLFSFRRFVSDIVSSCFESFLLFFIISFFFLSTRLSHPPTQGCLKTEPFPFLSPSAHLQRTLAPLTLLEIFYPCNSFHRHGGW